MNANEVFTVLKQSLASTDDLVVEFPWENRQAYALWLAQSYEYVRYVTRILALTGGRLPIQATKISNRFIQHSAEERGHDQLLINDCKGLGMTIDELPLLPEAEAFHKSLYYWIYQDRPLVVLGWAMFLEGFAVRQGEKIYQRALKAHGPKASNFLKVHIHEDQDHVDKGEQMIKQLQVDQLEDVRRGAVLYTELYKNLYRGIMNAAVDVHEGREQDQRLIA